MDAAEQLKPYDQWKQDPTPKNLKTAVDDLNPTIDSVLRSIGAAGDPYLKTQARVLASGAVQSYDPQYGANMHTWVSRQLLPLRRMKRRNQSVTDVPESIQLDAFKLMKAESKFLDDNDREPDLVELSDLTNLPKKRIEKVRALQMPTPAEGAFIDETGAAVGLAGSSSDYTSEAMDYVYHDLDHTDRKIMEYRSGYGGTRVIPSLEIARKLKLTPSQLTRRSAKIAYKVQEVEEALNSV